MAKRGLKIISLNIEGHRNLHLVTPYLIKAKADAYLLQEVFLSDLKNLAKLLHLNYHFAPMCKRPLKYYSDGKLEEWGVAILGQKLINFQIRYYHPKIKEIPEFGSGEIGPIAPVVVSIQMESDSGVITLATTHFPWAPNGDTSKEQKEELKNLLRILQDLKVGVLSGDFNAPRGGEIFTKLSQRYKDNIPPKIKTTIDGARHKAGQLELVVDGLFTAQECYASEVSLFDEVSDHWGISAKIRRTD